MANKKRKTNIEKQETEGSVMRSLAGIVKDVTGTLSQFPKDTTHEAWKQFLGAKSQEASGDLQPGKEFDLKSISADEQPANSTEKQQYIEPGINYFREFRGHSEGNIQRATQEIQEEIREIVMELRRLVSTSETLQNKYTAISTEQHTEKPGKYHVSFFKWLLIEIRSARMKVEDSGAWLAAMQSKKGKKGYWDMFAKHGTSFGLSNERNVATSVG